MRSKISVALRALDKLEDERPFCTLSFHQKEKESFNDGAFSIFFSILDIVPPTLRALAAACHQKGGKTIFDLAEEPGDTKELKLQCSPDATNLSHGKKPVHTNDRSYKLQQRGSNPNNHQRSKHHDEQAVVPNRHQLGRSSSPPYVMIFLCLLFVAYIWTTIKW